MSRRAAVRTASLILVAGIASRAAAQDKKPAEAADLARLFRGIEQKLMDAITSGDKEVWARVMDPSCVITTEEGQVLGKDQLLDELRPMPPGVKGDISVQDLSVRSYENIAIVRFLADEWQTVFGQRISTRYRVTDTFRREREDWKMLSSHISVVTHDPPGQEVSKDQWPSFVGNYRILPDGWTFTVELRDGLLYGGRDPKKLRPMIPLAPNVFVLSGSLGEWIFVTEKGAVTHIVSFRKLEPLVWTRVETPSPR